MSPAEETQLDSISRRMVPMGTFFLSVGTAVVTLILAGATFRADVMNRDQDHSKRIEALEKWQKEVSEKMVKTNNNVIRIGERLGVRDLERL